MKVPLIFSANNGFVPYLSVLLESIMDRANAADQYEIILLHSGVDKDNQSIIRTQLKKKENFSFRLINVSNEVATQTFYTKNMIFLTFGTGLGAGLILDGRLYEGTNGNAGEVGHIRLSENGPVGFGKFGSFEGFCSGGGIAQLGYTLGLAAYQRGETPLYFNPDTATNSWIWSRPLIVKIGKHRFCK